VIVNGPLGLVSLVALYPVVPAGKGVVPDERSAALCKRHSRVFCIQVAAKQLETPLQVLIQIFRFRTLVTVVIPTVL
jgi:hypothetical protein